LFPKSLRIYGHDYKVQRQKYPKLYAPNGDVTHVLGFFSGNEQLIAIRSDLNKRPAQEANILLHEVMHGIGYHTNIFVDIPDKEERIVDTFSNGLTMVLRDNPELVDYLKDSCKA